MINILQILRNNARTFARLDINSDFTMEKYRSCKYARRNSGRGMYVSASSSELGGSGYVKYEVWYSLEIPLFMNKCPKRSELRRGQRFAFCSSINYPHLHLTRHTFCKLNRTCPYPFQQITNKLSGNEVCVALLRLGLYVMARYLAKVCWNWSFQNFFFSFFAMLRYRGKFLIFVDFNVYVRFCLIR